MKVNAGEVSRVDTGNLQTLKTTCERDLLASTLLVLFLSRGCPTSPEGELSIVGHRVRLIEDDQLHARAEQTLRAGELLDLPPNHVDSSVVGGVELCEGLAAGGGGAGEEAVGYHRTLGRGWTAGADTMIDLMLLARSEV